MKWKTEKLAKYITQIRGVSYSKRDISGIHNKETIPILRANNIENNGILNFDNLVYVNKNKVKENQILKVNDIVIAASSGSINLVGKAAQLKNSDLKCSFGAFCKTVRPKNTINPNYLANFFKSEAYRKKISSLSRGINIKNLNNRNIDDLEIPVPPLPEQKRIADILDKADSLRKKRRQTIDQCDEFLKSTFLNMFGDPVTNPKGWEILKFGNCGNLERGKSKHRPRNAPELLGGPYPLIQTGDVANSRGYIRNYTQTYSELGLKQSRMWKAGVLCITIAANIANTGILMFDACFPDSVVGFSPEKKVVKIEYIQYWLSFLRKILEETAPAVAQKNINLQILRNLDIPVPPLQLQQKFASIVEKTEAVKKKMQKQLKELDDNFNSLMQRAFRGEL